MTSWQAGKARSLRDATPNQNPRRPGYASGMASRLSPITDATRLRGPDDGGPTGLSDLAEE